MITVEADYGFLAVRQAQQSGVHWHDWLPLCQSIYRCPRHDRRIARTYYYPSVPRKTSLVYADEMVQLKQKLEFFTEEPIGQPPCIEATLQGVFGLKANGPEDASHHRCPLHDI